MFLPESGLYKASSARPCWRLRGIASGLLMDSYVTVGMMLSVLPGACGERFMLLKVGFDRGIQDAYVACAPVRLKEVSAWRDR
jgi:hypothetical protein